VSNLTVAADLAASFDKAFHHVPVVGDGNDPAVRTEQEDRISAVLDAADVELVVLARYMRVLSDRFVAGWDQAMINIHHSFLPAFIGADPYRQAHRRGVKLIGATAHYVTAELDEGPIISQDVTTVSHRDSVADLTRKGRDVEVRVLADAVRAHVEHRVLADGNRTIVFA
jgi:formyltetrahydrofolate deformylase